MRIIKKFFASLFLIVFLLAALSLLTDLFSSELTSETRISYIFADFLLGVPSFVAGLLLWRVPTGTNKPTSAGTLAISTITDPNNPSIVWQISEVKRFPCNVLSFREYDGMKTFAVFIFLISIWNFYKYYLPHGVWWRWIPFANLADFCFHLLPLICCYCLLWITFDSKNFYGYAIGAFTMIFGLMYIISPVDFAPDFLPVLGGTDDALVGGGSILMGARSWWQAQEQNKNLNLVMNSLREGDHKTALNLLLSSKGVTLKSTNK